MKIRQSKGISTIEFALSLLILVPLLLGTGALGVNMIRTLGTIQLARDAGHMFARGVDFSDQGNKDLLATIGDNLGMRSTAGSGKGVVILSALTFVDINACNAVGAVDAGGAPTAGCANYNKWVFTQRLLIGNSNVRASNYGSPLTSGPTGVTLDSKGKISLSDYVTKAGARANFSSANGMNPYKVVDGVAQGLPSGQRLYLSEASCLGFGMPPFVGGTPTYSFSFF
jgi:hypothetical protein